MTPQLYRDRIAEPSLSRWTVTPVVTDSVLAALAGGPLTVAALAATVKLTTAQARETVARLAKLDIVRLSPGP
jgi:hypothetical protein